MEQRPFPSSLKHIHQSFEKAGAAYPAYRHILPFFESVYTLQEAALNNEQEVPSPLPDRNLEKGLEKGIPMMDRQHIEIDEAAGFALLKSLCKEADQASAKLSEGADVVKKSLDRDKGTIQKGFYLLMANDNKGLEQLADTLAVDKEVLVFFLYNSIWPSLAAHARQFTHQHMVNGNWNRGYCPVCGCLPGLSFLNDSGHRYFICEFCRHEWAAKRNLCPGCGPENDKKSVGYFYSDDEKAFRIYTCETCKTYIKTIDTRELIRPFFPPLEAIITLHLDLKAKELGYKPISEGMGAP